MFWILRFILFWAVWFVFADKKRWREILPVCILASFFGATTDNLVHHYYPWIYDTMQTNIVADITDDWSVYPIVTYLFIQWLPRERSFRKMFSYWFIWTGVAIGIEEVHLITGHMSYPTWWNLGWSYLADWILFWLFYQYYKILRFERVSS